MPSFLDTNKVGADVDGECLLTGTEDLLAGLTRGAMVRARVVGSDGVDLVVEALEVLTPTTDREPAAASAR